MSEQTKASMSKQLDKPLVDPRDRFVLRSKLKMKRYNRRIKIPLAKSRTMASIIVIWNKWETSQTPLRAV